MQIKLRNKTGVDPLQGTGLRHNPIYYRGGSEELKSSLISAGGQEAGQGVARRQILLPPGSRKKISQSAPVQRKESFTSHIGIQNWERDR